MSIVITKKIMNLWMRICKPKGGPKLSIVIRALIAWMAVSTLVALMVQVLFLIKAPNELLRAKWEASDALSFLASTASAVGTVTLGVVSVVQTEKAIKMQDNALRKDRRQSLINAQRPLLVIDSVESEDNRRIDKVGDTYLIGPGCFECGLKLKIRNCGEGVASHVMLERRCQPISKSCLKGVYEAVCIPVGECRELNLSADVLLSSSSIKIFYEGITGMGYSQSFYYSARADGGGKTHVSFGDGDYPQGVVGTLSVQAVIPREEAYSMAEGFYLRDKLDS